MACVLRRVERLKVVFFWKNAPVCYTRWVKTHRVCNILGEMISFEQCWHEKKKKRKKIFSLTIMHLTNPHKYKCLGVKNSVYQEKMKKIVLTHIERECFKKTNGGVYSKGLNS